MRALLVVSALVLPLACGCDDARTPAQPSSPGAAALPVATPAASPAELMISEVSLVPSSTNNGLTWYWVYFLLTETSGHGAAHITAVSVTVPGGETSQVDPRCWNADLVGIIRVDAASSSDAFTRGGMASREYCAPLISFSGFPSAVIITVRFVDAAGTPAEVATSFDLMNGSNAIRSGNGAGRLAS